MASYTSPCVSWVKDQVIPRLQWSDKNQDSCLLCIWGFFFKVSHDKETMPKNFHSFQPIPSYPTIREWEVLRSQTILPVPMEGPFYSSDSLCCACQVSRISYLICESARTQLVTWLPQFELHNIIGLNRIMYWLVTQQTAMCCAGSPGFLALWRLKGYRSAAQWTIWSLTRDGD